MIQIFAIREENVILCYYSILRGSNWSVPMDHKRFKDLQHIWCQGGEGALSSDSHGGPIFKSRCTVDVRQSTITQSVAGVAWHGARETKNNHYHQWGGRLCPMRIFPNESIHQTFQIVFYTMNNLSQSPTKSRESLITIKTLSTTII